MGVKKRVQFIAPFDELRGNVSGRQNLVYGSNNEKAWDSPVGKTYAKNYKPRYIVGKRSATNELYFQVKQKFAAINTAAARLMQAVMGGAKVVFDAINKDLNLLSAIQAKYLEAKEDGFEGTYYKYWVEQIREMLRARVAEIVFTYGGQTYHIYNPWGVDGSNASPIPSKILVKFWTILSTAGSTFKVIGLGTGIFDTSATRWADLIADARLNVLGLAALQVASQPDDLVGKMIDSTPYYLQKDGVYVTTQGMAEADGVYTLTSIEPTA